MLVSSQVFIKMCSASFSALLLSFTHHILSRLISPQSQSFYVFLQRHYIIYCTTWQLQHTHAPQSTTNYYLCPIIWEDEAIWHCNIETPPKIKTDAWKKKKEEVNNVSQPVGKTSAKWDFFESYVTDMEITAGSVSARPQILSLFCWVQSTSEGFNGCQTIGPKLQWATWNDKSHLESGLAGRLERSGTLEERHDEKLCNGCWEWNTTHLLAFSLTAQLPHVYCHRRNLNGKFSQGDISLDSYLFSQSIYATVMPSLCLVGADPPNFAISSASPVVAESSAAATTSAWTSWGGMHLPLIKKVSIHHSSTTVALIQSVSYDLHES